MSALGFIRGFRGVGVLRVQGLSHLGFEGFRFSGVGGLRAFRV